MLPNNNFQESSSANNGRENVRPATLSWSCSSPRRHHQKRLQETTGADKFRQLPRVLASICIFANRKKLQSIDSSLILPGNRLTMTAPAGQPTHRPATVWGLGQTSLESHVCGGRSIILLKLLAKLTRPSRVGRRQGSRQQVSAKQQHRSIIERTFRRLKRSHPHLRPANLTPLIQLMGSLQTHKRFVPTK